MFRNYILKIKHFPVLSLTRSFSLSDNKNYINSINTKYLKSICLHNQTFRNTFIRKNSFCTTKTALKHNELIENELKTLSIKFPFPKNVLNNYYSILLKELKLSNQITSIHKLAPHRKGDKYREWTCTYSIKWPEETKISATAITKSEASNIAAWKVLYLLQKNKKLSANGQPMLYDKETFNKITKNTYLPIVLSKDVEKNLVKICDIYDKLKVNIEEYDADLGVKNEKDLEGEENFSNMYSLDRQRYGPPSTYYAKELVELPINRYREQIEKLLDSNRVIIIRGEPGCGKSTRVPQYVLEHWVQNNGLRPVNIAVTQPRRIAAISLAERVARERNEYVGDVVGYHVRLHSKWNSRNGRIIYCTTGILLRQIQEDPSLQNFTHVILDEAHERDVNTDLTLNLLRHAQNLNPGLKIIIMSATIDVELFQKYFNNAPVLNIPGFTYPVKKHFLDDLKGIQLKKTKEMLENNTPSVIFDDFARVVKWIHENKPEGAVLCFLPGWDEILRVKNLLIQTLNQNNTLILTLHSKLSDADQKRIFSHPPDGVRKIILATNIAETSVTVDDVVYVVDSGIHKETRFDSERGVSIMDKHWASQSSIRQRTGRAGRTRSGESFHLFTKNKYENLEPYSLPEILRMSLTKIVLDGKVYSNNMDAVEFFSKLPCPPEDGAIFKAVDELKDLSLLDENEDVTPIGYALSKFQLPPKLSKAMVQSVLYKCVTPLVDIATIFSSDSEMFSTSLTDKQGIKDVKKNICPNSDHVALMLILEQWLDYVENEEYLEADLLCSKFNLVPRKLNTIRKLQTIHMEYLKKYLQPVIDLSNDFSDNKEIINGVLLSGVGNVLTHRKWDIVKGRLKNADVFITKNGQKAVITPESVNSKKREFKSPYFVYINETRSVIRRQTLIRETSSINPITLLLFKNGKIIKKISKKEGVLLKFEGTNLEFQLSESQAELIKNSKDAINKLETYLLNHLTQGGEINQEILKNWDSILNILNNTIKSDVLY